MTEAPLPQTGPPDWAGSRTLFPSREAKHCPIRTEPAGGAATAGYVRQIPPNQARPAQEVPSIFASLNSFFRVMCRTPLLMRVQHSEHRHFSEIGHSF